jgi:hypothetical protein
LNGNVVAKIMSTKLSLRKPPSNTTILMYCVTIDYYRRAALFYHTGYHKAVNKAFEEKVKL